MQSPRISLLCDSIELAALNHNSSLSLDDLGRIFYPGSDVLDSPEEPGSVAELVDALSLAKQRSISCNGLYPFTVSERAIESKATGDFDVYLFLLLGASLKIGGPPNLGTLQSNFRRFFEDLVCAALRSAGFSAEVISIPREFRNLPKSLIPSLEQVNLRFGDIGVLHHEKITSDDNDLDTDIVCVPLPGNGGRSSWPSIQIQCATGSLPSLQSKIQEGSETFGSVWKVGFSKSVSLRAAATPDELLRLVDVHWDRLCLGGWILDRTRITYLASRGEIKGVPNEVTTFWKDLWVSKGNLNWISTF